MPSLTHKTSFKVGGVFGFKSSVSKMEIIFDKNVYEVGQTVRVRFVVDNSDCDKDVKSLKLKLKRKLFVSVNDTAVVLNSGKRTRHDSCYIVDVRGDGCPGKQITERVLEFKIPEWDQDTHDE